MALLAVLVGRLLGGDDRPLRLEPRRAILADPLAFDPRRTDEFEHAAASGLSHVLYAKSPGGVLKTAERTARFRPLIDEAADGSRLDPELVEAIVFLESGGRSEVIAGHDPAAAAGLTQIVAETGTNLLAMPIDLQASRRLTDRLAVAVRRGATRQAERLRRARRRVDPRFEPREALAGTVRYLTIARNRFGRDDLAVVSYHMGIGNLESVLRAYTGADRARPVGEIVRERGLSYARIYFDSSPVHHAAAWRRLARFADSSRDYYWRVLAAREIMRLFREDRERLEELAAVHAQSASGEEALHPASETDRFADPSDVARAWNDGLLQPLPRDPRLYIRLDARMGRLAARLGRRPELYRGLRPEALALLLYLAAEVHKLGGGSAPLTVASTVRDEAYERLAFGPKSQAAGGDSLHTTGYAFDILRRYASGSQAAAFQFELERLQALALVVWVRDRTTIHVTVSSLAKALVPAVLQEPARTPRAVRRSGMTRLGDRTAARE